MFRDRVRPFIGPLVIGLAAWCATGGLTVASASDASVRIVDPAPWWVFVVSVILAWLVPAWRRRPVLTIPALVSTLPWWPVPLPAIALIWTGPLAWLPIGLTFIVVVASTLGRIVSGIAMGTSPARTTIAVASLTLAFALVTAVILAPRLPGGDEPHYLMITESLIRDGDLRIENNHARGDYAAFFEGTLERPDFIQRAQDGTIVSIHAPGLAVLVLPLHWLFGYRGAQAMVLVLAALTGALVWRTAWRVTGDSGAAWFAWASIALSTTFLVQGVTLYPDGPGMLAVAAGAWLIVRLGQARVPTPRVVAVSVLLAGLPWLHTRFAVIAGMLAVMIVWQIGREKAPVAQRAIRLAAFALVPAVSAAAWFAYFRLLYGTFNPAAPYGTNAGADTSPTFIPGAVAGILFDQQFGLLVYSPVFFAAIVAGVRGLTDRKAPWPRAFGIAVLLYLAVIGLYWMWWAGVPASPARFITAVLPLLAIGQAATWVNAGRPARLLWAATLTFSAGLSIVLLAVERGVLIWNVRDAHARWLDWMGPVASLARGWPSFFWDLTPQVASSEWPFAVHILVALLVWSLAAALAMFLMRRIATADVTRQSWVVAMVFLPAMMAFVQAGWWVSAGAPLNPIRSQVPILRGAALGEAVYLVRGFSVLRLAAPAIDMELRPDLARAPEMAAAEWGRFDLLPAGAYELRVTSRRPMRGRLWFRTDRAATPWQGFDLQGLSAQSFSFEAPVDVADASLVPEEALRGFGGEVVLVPRIVRPAVDRGARAVVRLESGDAFVLDRSAILEPDGFWVAGDATTEFVLAAGARAKVATLRLGNGRISNAVVVTAGAYVETVRLEPFEGRLVTVPAGPGGVTVIRIQSPAGFRPSDDGQSEDRRLLGVRVQ